MMYSAVTQNNGLVKVGTTDHILGETERALNIRIGQTLYGEPITSFFPKRACKTQPNAKGGLDIFVPGHLLKGRQCNVGSTAQMQTSYAGYGDWEDNHF